MRNCLAVRDRILVILSFPLYPYQEEFSEIVIRAVLARDGSEVVAVQCRQSGKTEAMAIATLSLAIYWITELQENFHVGIFAPAESQSIRIMRLRLQRRLSGIIKWLNQNGLGIDLGKGRLTGLFIIKNMLNGCEAHIRSMSADRTANITGETLNMILFEQPEDMDADKIEADIFPMGAAVGGARIFSGSAKNTIINTYYYDALTKNLNNSILFDHVDWKEAAKYSKIYENYVTREMHRLRPDNPAFRAMYCNEWAASELKFITRDLLCTDLYEADPKLDLISSVCGGVDVGKEHDSTVATVIGEVKPVHYILGWLELFGTDYEDQADTVAEFLKQYKALLNRSFDNVCIDSTGAGDPVEDMMRRRLRGISHRVTGFTYTAKSKDKVGKQIDAEFRQHRIKYPKAFPDTPEGHEQQRCKTRFIDQFLDLERIYKGGLLSLNHPDREGCHNDYCSSLELALEASLSKPAPLTYMPLW